MDLENLKTTPITQKYITEKYKKNITKKYRKNRSHLARRKVGVLSAKKQEGGKVLGEGGFGCVISPPLKCKETFGKEPYSIDENYISKIVEYDEDDTDVWTELHIGKFLLKIDKTQRYFSPIMNGCFLHKQRNRNLKYSSQKPQKKTSNSVYNSYSKNNNRNKGVCNIYLNTRYLNLLSKNAGVNLEDIYDSQDPRLSRYMIDNYKSIFYHFCKGLLILKKNKIIHCDIKSLNLMLKYNTQRNTAQMTFIDFGLSDKVDKMYSESDLTYLFGKGTSTHKPLEVFILDEFLYQIQEGKFNKQEFLKTMLGKFMENVKYYSKYLYFTRFGMGDKKIIPSQTGLESYGNNTDFFMVYNYLEKLYKSKKLPTVFFDEKNAYKWDVFSLGIVFAEILANYNIDDQRAKNLVGKMTHIYYWDRYTIEQCLADPLFVNI